jgi:hypothetical protein
MCLGLLLLTFPIYKCTKAPESGNPTSTTTTTTASTTTTTTNTNGFVHPGVLNTQASLDFIGSQANAGDATRTAAYQKVLDFISSHTYPASFYSTVVVGSNGATSPSKSQIRSDAELVYAIALCWARTGDAQYASQAIGILNGWAGTFKNYALLDASTNVNQPDLEASWTTPSFVAAAEIMRYYKVNGKLAGWSDADIATFSNFLLTVNTAYISMVPQYANNWNASAGYAQMAIGVFLDNKAIYQSGFAMLTGNFPSIIQADGTLPELCDRMDCVHYQYSLTAYAYAAELARLQGDNSLWTANSNRISAGYDFMRNAYSQSTGCNYCTITSQVFPGTEVAYNYYKTSNLQYLRALDAPLGVTSDNTFLGFTTYTHYNVPGL